MKRILMLAGLVGLFGACTPNVGRELFACTTSDDCTQGRECKGGFCRGRGTDGTCLATTCAVEQSTCGQLSDGCGQVLDCGACQPIPGGLSECVMGSCRASCPLGSRVCAGACVLESKESCGASCAPCPRPVGGDAACSSGRCELTCPPGTRYCARSNACLAESVMACGVGCAVCEAPPGQDGGATCSGVGSADGGVCDFVVDLPVFRTQPLALTVGEDQPFELSVDVAVSGQASYQWRRNGVAIPVSAVATSTSRRLLVANAAIGANGSGGLYDVEVANTLLSKQSSARSDQVAVQVIGKPTIVTPPNGGVFLAGSTVTLRVVASGSGALSYQWFKDNQVLPGRTLDLLELQNFSIADVGAYSVEVSSTNSVPSQSPVVTRSRSSTVSVEVNRPPIIMVQPDAGTFVVGTTATLSVVAVPGIAGATLGFDWLKDGVVIRADAGASFSLPSVQKSDEANYAVVVKSFIQSTTAPTTSELTRLVVNQPPLIVTQPTSVTATTGSSVSLTVGAVTDAGTLSYQWLRNDAGIAGGTQATLSFASLQAVNAGLYSVVVRNTLDGTVASQQSNTATVAVGVNTPVITAPSSIMVDDAGVASTQDQGGGASYEWSISNGTLVGPANTRAVVFTSSSVGNLQLAVSVSDAVSRADAGVTVQVMPVPNSWNTRALMSSPRSSHTATLLNDGRVLVAGGFDGNQVLASAEVFDTNTNRWTTVGSLPGTRFGHSATLLANGRVLVAGGDNGATVNTAALFDPATNQWTGTGSMTTPRVFHSAARLLDGRVIVVGGNVNAGFTAGVEIYDPATGNWTPASPLQAAARSNFAMAVMPTTGRVVAASGDTQSGGTVSAEYYNVTSNQWTFGAATNMAAVHAYARDAVVVSGTRMFVFGGSNGSNNIGTVEVYSTATNQWTSFPSVLPRSDMTAVLIDSNRALVVGGANPRPASVATAQLVTFSPPSVVSVPSMAAPRYFHTATRLNDGTVLVTGGKNGSNTLQSAESYAP